MFLYFSFHFILFQAKQAGMFFFHLSDFLLSLRSLKIINQSRIIVISSVSCQRCFARIEKRTMTENSCFSWCVSLGGDFSVPEWASRKMRTQLRIRWCKDVTRKRNWPLKYAYYFWLPSLSLKRLLLSFLSKEKSAKISSKFQSLLGIAHWGGGTLIGYD